MICEAHERPLSVSPSKGNQGTTRGKEKILLTSVGIELTTSGLDLPLLCRLSYEVGQRKSGTIQVVNRGEEKIRVDLIWRSWVRFPPIPTDFFFTSCGSLIPFTRANAQWVFHGLHIALKLHFRVNSLFHHLCS